MGVCFNRLIMMTAALCLVKTGAVLSQTENTLYDYCKTLYGLDEKKLYETTVDRMNDYLTKYPKGENAAEVQFSLSRVHENRKKRDRAFVSYYKMTALYPESPKVSEAKAKAREMVTNNTNLSPIKEKLYSFLESPITEDEFPDRYHLFLQGLKDLIYPKLNEALISECRVFLGTFPDHAGAPQVAEWMGEMYMVNKMNWEALAAYLQVIHLYGESDRVMSCRLKIGRLFSDRLKKYEKAVGTYEAILSTGTDSLFGGEVQWNLAQVLENKLQNYSRAVQEYQNLVDRFPVSSYSVEALMKKANIHVSKLKQYEAGIQTYRQVVEKFSDDSDAPEALVRAGEVYEKKMKDYENAIKTYREISEKYPSNSQSAEKLFKAAELAEKKLKETDRAVMLYQEVVDKFGSEKVAEKARRKIESLQKKSDEE